VFLTKKRERKGKEKRREKGKTYLVVLSF